MKAMARVSVATVVITCPKCLRFIPEGVSVDAIRDEWGNVVEQRESYLIIWTPETVPLDVRCSACGWAGQTSPSYDD